MSIIVYPNFLFANGQVLHVIGEPLRSSIDGNRFLPLPLILNTVMLKPIVFT